MAMSIKIKSGSNFIDYIDTIYPVGSIFQSMDSTSPASMYGGTWTAITGRFLYANSSTATGGENTHTLTVAEMPSHSHTTSKWVVHDIGWHTHKASSAVPTASQQSNTYTPFNNGGITVTNTGSSHAHNNMPAYQSCYTWKRTA